MELKKRLKGAVITGATIAATTFGTMAEGTEAERPEDTVVAKPKIESIADFVNAVKKAQLQRAELQKAASDFVIQNRTEIEEFLIDVKENPTEAVDTFITKMEEKSTGTSKKDWEKLKQIAPDALLGIHKKQQIYSGVFLLTVLGLMVMLCGVVTKLAVNVAFDKDILFTMNESFLKNTTLAGLLVLVGINVLDRLSETRENITGAIVTEMEAQHFSQNGEAAKGIFQSDEIKLTPSTPVHISEKKPINKAIAEGRQATRE